jgi:anhydro-N-acetylmuramic acid kinase
MTERRPLVAIGLMSGTSMDGIDAALLRTDGEGAVERGPFRTTPYSDPFRARLRGVLGGRGSVAEVERDLTLLHATAVEELLAEAGLQPNQVDILGFHGHTILHAPDRGRTWQIGDGALLARTTEIDTIHDFRSADVAAGGEGAPLAPAYHAALSLGLERPLAVLNIGGVANVTWIGGEGALLAFDTGPGNALIDDWMQARTGHPVDRGGALALAGSADSSAIAQLLAHPYFDRAPPKSLDRDAFAHAMGTLGAHADADGAATLTELTAAAVAAALRHLPERPRRWLVTGGGRSNPALMAALARRLEAPVQPVEAVGWNGDALEAEAFAYLAVRSRKGLPISFPGTTGAPRPLTGGRLSRATP